MSQASTAIFHLPAIDQIYWVNKGKFSKNDLLIITNISESLSQNELYQAIQLHVLKYYTCSCKSKTRSTRKKVFFIICSIFSLLTFQLYVIFAKKQNQNRKKKHFSFCSFCCWFLFWEYAMVHHLSIWYSIFLEEKSVLFWNY